MKIFSNIYNKVMHVSRSKYASFILGVVSFFEAIFLPLPPDILLVSMVMSDKTRYIKYFSITLLFSILGGISGYFIGMFCIDLAYKYIVLYGYADSYMQVQTWFSYWGFWIIFVAGFTPIPYKLFTLGAGSFHMSLLPFIVASIISRGLRYGLISCITKIFESRITSSIVKYIDLVGWMTVLIFAVYYYFRWV